MKSIYTFLFLMIFLAFSAKAGNGWERQYCNNSGRLNSVQFANLDMGWTCSENKIFNTTDGGQSWNLQYYMGVGWYINAVYVIDEGKLFACGEGGSMFVTTNSGTNWLKVGNLTSSETLNYISFASSNIGFAVGNTGVILRTSNGGEYWKTVDSSKSYTLWSLFFIDSVRGWAVGSDGVILTTENAGIKWTTQNSNTSKTLKSVSFINANTGWIVGGTDNKGIILKTTNGGKDWLTYKEDDINYLNSVCFADSVSGWIAGGNEQPTETRLIMHTSNAGASWETQLEESGPPLYSTCFINSAIGWAVGGTSEQGLILKTDNGGITDVNENNNDKTDFTIFPNPADNVVNLKLKSTDINTSVSIYNIYGRKIKEFQNPGLTESGKIEISVQDLTDGVYYIKTGNNPFTKPLIVLR